MLELILFAALLAVAASVAYTSVKTGISPMPSSSKMTKAMLGAVNEKGIGKGIIIDLGSGWGMLAITFAKAYPNSKVIGYELSFFPWLVSMILRKFFGLDNLDFYRKDFLKEDINQASFLLAYLHPGGMSALKAKINNDKIKDVTLISSTFALYEIKEEKTIFLNDLYKTPIYVYDL